ncbi:hypothetical protein L5515_002446 [Caenorhabditis briggsae]|uniref:C-type lectin domain-containing protein n=3 Tax=Caenorhabditis briggsae TaxID=6238 RepID=A0AAE9E433_CAEBR|nr:hypothetical protein L5515_002446 [Caenorhabditis briggsae]
MKSSLVFLLLSLTPPTFAQWKVDSSLRDACKQMDGEWKARYDEQSIIGDRCTMTFNVAVRDQNDANSFCELYAPWRLIKAEIGNNGRPTVTCHVEATLTCKDGWTQMFGYCFMMPDKHNIFTYEQAVQQCKATDNSEIAHLQHKYIVGVWRKFFTGVGQIWVHATEPWDQYVQKTNTVDGPHLALAFNGHHYEFGVPANSLIRVNEKIRLQVLCQYKPPPNPAEINYLGQRYSEIYYPVVPVENGVLVRSASSYTRTAKNMDVCKETLKPFLSADVGPFLPDEETLEQLTKYHQDLVWLTRSGAEVKLDMRAMAWKTCQKESNPFEVKVKDGPSGTIPVKNIQNPSATCENMRSAAIAHSKGHPAELRVMSDSRSLPIWCKLGRHAMFDFEKPPNYHVFERANGEKIGHRLFKEKMTFEEAQKTCEGDGGVLTGINSREEADFLAEVAKKEGANKNSQMWLGGHRKDICANINGYVKNPNDECSRNKVIAWQNNVATQFYDDWWKDAPGILNPDYASGKQECLTYVYGNPGWADKKSKGFLDDVGCNGKLPFFCTKKLKLVRTNQ